MPSYITVLHAAAAAKAIYKNLDESEDEDFQNLVLLGGFFDPKNDDRLGWKTDKKTGDIKDAGGGSAGVYKYTSGTDQYVISYRGSKGAKDWKVDDVQIGLNKTVDRASDCIKYARQIQWQYPKAFILVVGHSLGGWLAQVVGVECDLPFITFNAPPAGRAMSGDPRAVGFRRGVNLRVNWDPVSRAPGKHIGPLITIPHYGKNIANAHTGAAFMKSVKRSPFANQEAASFIDEKNLRRR